MGSPVRQAVQTVLGPLVSCQNVHGLTGSIYGIRIKTQVNTKVLNECPQVPEEDSEIVNSTVFSDVLCNETRSPAKEYFK